MYTKFFIVGAAMFAFALAANATELVGVPEITDADTVIIAGEKVRILDMDAPETDQFCLDSKGDAWNCGIAARDALAKRVGSRSWECAGTVHDTFRRLLVSCVVDNVNISQWMVRAGWALSPTHKGYSHRFDGDQELARGENVGLWAGAFIAPWDWRRRNCKTLVYGAAAVPIDAQKKLCGSPSEPLVPGCSIKANFRRDACIYHLEGGLSYGKMDMAKAGRRWFCSTIEAEAAGCRRAAR